MPLPKDFELFQFSLVPATGRCDSTAHATDIERLSDPRQPARM